MTSEQLILPPGAMTSSNKPHVSPGPDLTQHHTQLELEMLTGFTWRREKVSFQRISVMGYYSNYVKMCCFFMLWNITFFFPRAGFLCVTVLELAVVDQTRLALDSHLPASASRVLRHAPPPHVFLCVCVILF